MFLGRIGGDLATQHIQGADQPGSRFTRLNEKREPVATERSSWITRFTFRHEAVHLLYRCGFEVESLTGDYRGGPVTENSQLIFVARLRDDA